MSKHPTTQYIVYQDLNEPTTVFVARADEMVTGTFRPIAGPFDSEREAKKAARDAVKGADD